MSGTTISGSYPNGISLDPATQNPTTLTGSAVIGNPSGAGVLVGGSSASPAFTIGNAGTIRSTGTTIGADGVLISGAGTLSNQIGGLIGGVYAGVAIYASGTVLNSGSIGASLAGTGRGVFLPAGGAVVNGAGGLISGAATGISLIAAGVVLNSGSIAGGSRYGVASTGVGAVTDNASSSIAGYIAGVSLGAGGTVVNSGAIGASATAGNGLSLNTSAHVVTPLSGGVELGGSGGVSNASTGVIASNFFGVALTSGGSLVNAGLIVGSASAGGYGVLLQGGAGLTNAATGTISGGSDGVLGYGTIASRVTNAGQITGVNHSGVELVGGGSVSNAATGTITGNGEGVFGYGTAVVTVTNAGQIAGLTRSGIELSGGGTVGNLAGAGVTAPNYGIILFAPGTVTNAGTVLAQTGTNTTASHISGVALVNGGYAVNSATGTIASNNIGIQAFNAAANVTNTGSISDSRFQAGAGVQLRAGGTIVNGAGGRITSQWIGTQIGAGANNGTAAYANGTVLNAGFIQAADTIGDGAAVWIKGTGLISNAAGGTITGGGFGVVSYSAVTITNAGLIAGTEYALFAATAGVADRVIVTPGARFSGLVEGSATAGTAVGTLELMAGGAGSVSGFGSQYVGFSQVTLDAGARWSLAGTVAAAQTLAFAAGASLTLANPTAVQGTIANFATTDTIALAGLTDVTSATLGTGNVLSIAQSAGPTISLQLDPAQSFSGTSFAVAVAGGNTSITVPCFAAGTRIRTRRGAVAVEQLRVGDVVRNPWGEELPIIWLGHRRVDCRRHPSPADIMPVRVRAGAFGPGQPARALWLSPDHAVFVDGDLVPVRHLLNGASIAQVAVDSVEYWHVELPRHDVLLAEGLACESYLDTQNRHAFGGGQVVQAHADFAAPDRAALEIWDGSACGRLVRGGPALAALRTRLLAGVDWADGPDLHVLADGVRVDPLWVDGPVRHFELPAATSLVLASRRAVPAEVFVERDDRRRLGVAVTALRLDGRDLAPGLVEGEGWFAAEAGWRWTDGAAALPCCRQAVVTLAPLLRYPAAAPELRRHVA